MNSGNANACTGRQGMEDAREMVRFTERALNLPAGSVLAGSTGRIGVPLPMDHIRAGIIEAGGLAGLDGRPRRPGRRGHHDERHAIQANCRELPARRQGGPHRRNLQGGRHDPAPA